MTVAVSSYLNQKLHLIHQKQSETLLVPQASCEPQHWQSDRVTLHSQRSTERPLSATLSTARRACNPNPK